MAVSAMAECSACGRSVAGVSRTTHRCDDCATVNQPRKLWTVSPWASFSVDASAQRFVAEHPDGAELREIGRALGVTHQRVAQIERTALAHMTKRLRLAGVAAEDALAFLMRDESSRAMGGACT